MTGPADRGAVVAGPDVFGPHASRPLVKLSDDAHPFDDEEGLYAAVTTTQRPFAVPLTDDAFREGSLPRQSFVNPWTIATVKHADVGGIEARLTVAVTDRIAREAAGYVGVEPGSP